MDLVLRSIRIDNTYIHDQWIIFKTLLMYVSTVFAVKKWRTAKSREMFV